MNSTTYSFDVANASGRLPYGVSRENVSFTGLPGTGTSCQISFWFEKGEEDEKLMSGPGGIMVILSLRLSSTLGKDLVASASTILPGATNSTIHTYRLLLTLPPAGTRV
ncbi:hypothetical protein E1B28_012800 [Marasmius oreades]|uniref:Uncharacterized protein n=1 Tax=Marasmius oreades TaxID=181124 RepID=A0A9P7RSF2_9AGAR|nr:uncharacterized protein E1B28_012800 [Marasmius oreades]KAG7088845.1 hypothetical protein E1B28_012800 [Marasmius oreades]